MKRTGLLLLLIPIILFSQFGCVTDDSTTLAVDALRKRLNDSDALIATHTTTITQLTAQLAQKATAAEVAAAKADAATALAKANAMTTPPATNYESRIAALESWKTSLVAVNPVIPPPAGGTTTGTITTFLDPAAPMFIGNTAGYSFIVRFKNTGTTTLYIQPILRIKQASGSAATAVNKLVITSTTSSYSPLTFVLAPPIAPPPTTNMIQAIPVGGGYNSNGQIPIFGNSEIIVTFTIEMTTAVATQWYITIDPSVS
jgi:hypothetical protein